MSFMKLITKDKIKCDYCDLETNNRLSFTSHINSCEIVKNNLDKIIEEYKSGKSIRNIVVDYKISRNLILRIFNKKSISIRSKGESLRGKRRPHTEENKKKMSELKKTFYKNNPDKHPWKKSSKFKSKPCENFKKIVEELNIFYIEEMTPSNERLFSIDIALPQYKIAIEINGNQHYNKDGKLKDYYQQRHDFIKNLGWTIHEIHYSICFDDEFIKNTIQKMISGKKLFEFDYDAYLISKLNRKRKFCKCGNTYKTGKSCAKCASEARRKTKRPDYTELLKLVEKIGYVQTGNKFGVSDTCIRKWIKFYEKEKETH